MRYSTLSSEQCASILSGWHLANSCSGRVNVGIFNTAPTRMFLLQGAEKFRTNHFSETMLKGICVAVKPNCKFSLCLLHQPVMGINIASKPFQILLQKVKWAPYLKN